MLDKISIEVIAPYDETAYLNFTEGATPSELLGLAFTFIGCCHASGLASTYKLINLLSTAIETGVPLPTLEALREVEEGEEETK